jgi:hypothetical protein
LSVTRTPGITFSSVFVFAVTAAAPSSEYSASSWVVSCVVYAASALSRPFAVTATSDSDPGLAGRQDQAVLTAAFLTIAAATGPAVFALTAFATSEASTLR